MSDVKKEANDLLSKILGKPADLEQMLFEYAVKRFKNSWHEQNRDERKRRMRFVLDLSRELDVIRQTTNFSTAFCEMAIEAVITGDEKDLKVWADSFDFEGEREDLRERYCPLFKRFKEICGEALLTWSKSTKVQA